MNLCLVARNKAVGLIGLDAPRTRDIMRMVRRDSYAAGDKIGPWPIYALDADELIAGRDNAHMDFRVSILKLCDPDGPCVVVSTVCRTRNRFGRAYLAMVIPFHKFGLRRRMAGAATANRL